MFINKNYYRKVSKRIITFIFTLLVIYILFKLSIFYVPFLIALIICLIIEPLIKKIMKITKFTRKTSAIITLIIIFSIIIISIIYGIIGIIGETENILNNLNDNISNISNLFFYFINKFNLDNFKLHENAKELIINFFNNMIEEGKIILQNILINILKNIKNFPKMLLCIGITILATYFTCTDRMYIIDQLEHHLPRNWANKVGNKIKEIISSLGDYLKAQIILVLITFIIVIFGLLMFSLMGLNVKYPLLMAIFISFVDALPILGSGSVIIPWAIISGFNGNIKLAFLLIFLYLVIIIIRQLLEPKIVSKHIGIHPIFTLMSMYTGFKINGIYGIFIGPIILIILNNVFENMLDNGFVKTILDKR